MKRDVRGSVLRTLAHLRGEAMDWEARTGKRCSLVCSVVGCCVVLRVSNRWVGEHAPCVERLFVMAGEGAMSGMHFL